MSTEPARPLPARPNRPQRPRKKRRIQSRSVVLIGLMGAGKTTIGRRLARYFGLPFVDSDQEIERKAGLTITEFFRVHGEESFRQEERRVIAEILEGPPVILATGGGAFMNAQTRALIQEKAISVWLRCPLPVLVKRVEVRSHRPLLQGKDARTVLEELMKVRDPVYALADMTINCGDEHVERSMHRVANALKTPHQKPVKVPVALGRSAYNILIGSGLLSQVGEYLAPVLPVPHVVIVTDENVAPLYLSTVVESLKRSGIRQHAVIVPPGDASKSLRWFEKITDDILRNGIERKTTVVALGGGVVGDLAGFVAATLMRGLPFVQIPTTLLSQVDSSVGGKTGINTPAGKNLLGCFHQPLAVITDVSTLATLPKRELKAGYAEIVKSGLISDPALFAWCEENGAALLTDDIAAQVEAVKRACAFKAAIVAEDEYERKKDGGRALLNLGHTFGHALEAEFHYDGRLVHGEAVSIGLNLAFALSVELGLCPESDHQRVRQHLHKMGMPSSVHDIKATIHADSIMSHMQNDKKKDNGKLSFILVRGVGQAFIASDVSNDSVKKILLEDGCAG